MDDSESDMMSRRVKAMIRAAEIDERAFDAERRLLSAVIRRAYTDLWQTVDQNAARDARKWVESEDEQEFSFCWACGELGWRAEIVRQALLEKEAKGLEFRGSWL